MSGSSLEWAAKFSKKGKTIFLKVICVLFYDHPSVEHGFESNYRKINGQNTIPSITSLLNTSQNWETEDKFLLLQINSFGAQ